MNAIDPQATAVTRARYDRNARRYDLMTRGSERLLAPTRAALWQRVRGPRVLEVGVGTGKSFPYYPAGMTITAIDFSPRMLEQARLHAAQDHIAIDLREADVQALPFDGASFDTAIASCVFCSVPDPLLGLRELRRVLVPDGQLLLLEHVLMIAEGAPNPAIFDVPAGQEVSSRRRSSKRTGTTGRMS
jgi:ubiquinone/menaquinone biosynthesis C-methylase UbiE